MKHYLPKELSILESTGVAACGIYISKEKFGDDMTTNRQDVICERCRASRIYREVKNQQKCEHCGRIVGCDYRGRKHKCRCRKAVAR